MKIYKGQKGKGKSGGHKGGTIKAPKMKALRDPDAHATHHQANAANGMPGGMCPTGDCGQDMEVPTE